MLGLDPSIQKEKTNKKEPELDPRALSVRTVKPEDDRKSVSGSSEDDRKESPGMTEKKPEPAGGGQG